jgi:hypothetical protein
MRRDEPTLSTSDHSEQAPKRSLAPAVVLAVLAPVVGEVLMGSTRLSFIFVLLPEIMVWGCGALLAREAVRRWRGGWISLMVLGIALGVAEEFVIQQTSLAPLPWLNASHVYGRYFGVNFVWALALLVFESVWIVLVPVEFAETIFPRRQSELWLRNRGLATCGVIFVLGSFVAWYLWTQRARPMVFHVEVYKPPLSYILAGVAAIVLLILAAFALRGVGHTRTNAKGWTPPAWAIGFVAFVLGAPWFAVIGWAYGSNPQLPVRTAILAGMAWSIAAFLLFRWWTASAAWGKMHGLTAACGALMASMAMGFLAAPWKRADLIAKIVLDLVAVVAMIFLVQRERRSTAGQASNLR